MPGAGMLCFQMILKIRVTEAPVVMIAAHRFHGIEAAVLAALIAAVLAGVAVVKAQAAVLAEVIRIVRIHCAHSLGAVGVALAALLAQLAGFAELVLVFLIRDPAVAARADVLFPLGAFHAGLAVRAAAGIGVVHAAFLAQAAVLADLLGQQTFLALLAGCVAIDAVDDAGIIVVHALVHRTEAGVAQRAVHRVAVIVCAVLAEAAGVADGYGAAGALIALAAQLVILADVAFAAGRAVRILHAVGALVALIAPKGCIEQTLTTIVAVEFSEAVGVAVNSAEPATVAAILSPVVVVAVFAILAVVVVFPKGVGMKLQTRHQREQHYKHQQDADDATSCVCFCHTIISSLKIILKIFMRFVLPDLNTVDDRSKIVFGYRTEEKSVYQTLALCLPHLLGQLSVCIIIHKENDTAVFRVSFYLVTDCHSFFEHPW